VVGLEECFSDKKILSFQTFQGHLDENGIRMKAGKGLTIGRTNFGKYG
jgi:hypothetical protein